MLLGFLLAPQISQEVIVTKIKPLARYNLAFLLLLNVVNIQYRRLSSVLLRQGRLLLYSVLLCNLVVGLLGFGISRLIWPQIATSALLILAISAGFSAASFALLLGLRPEFNMLATLLSSFLIPFTLPGLLYLLLGSSVDLHAQQMMLEMCAMIFIPMGIERLLYFLWPAAKDALRKHSTALIPLCLGFTGLILALSSYDYLSQQNMGQLLKIIAGGAYILVLNFALSGLLVFFLPIKSQMALLIGSMVNNSGLAAVLALGYFGSFELGVAIMFSIWWYLSSFFLKSWVLLRYRVF